jgi:hypothetical protein
LLGRVREALSHWHPDPPCLDRDLRLDLLPLGVDTELFRPRSKSELRRRLGLPLDRLVLVSLGRISAADKADLLPALRILRDLVRQRPERELLWVIGGAARDGEERIVDDYARRLGIARSVRLIGDCSAERHLWLAAADVFLSPADSIQETFGIAPIEAMACGTPQLVSDWDGYRDTVEHGRTGFRVPTYWAPYGDDLDALGPLLEAQGLADHLLLAQSVVVEPAALRRYLEVLLDDPALRSRLGAASRRTAEARFSWPVVIRQYEALWAELSEIASSASGRQPPDRGESDFDRPFYLDAFAGYPSRLLTDDLAVGIGDAGLRLIRGEEELPAYREYAGIYSVPAIEAVLCRLADGDPSAGGETIGGLVRALTAGCQLSEGPARRLVLWLLKYGFVELEERTSLTETERRAGATED